MSNSARPQRRQPTRLPRPWDSPGKDTGVGCHCLLLLLLLSRFSHVRLCETPETAAHQALPSLGFSRQEHWSGLPFLLQCMKVKSESEVAQSCLTLRDPMDCSPPGSSVYGILQARVPEWGAIAFSVHFFFITVECAVKNILPRRLWLRGRIM